MTKQKINFYKTQQQYKVRYVEMHMLGDLDFEENNNTVNLEFDFVELYYVNFENSDVEQIGNLCVVGI